MKLRKSTKTWQKTRKPNLLRHKSGRYYARAFAGGKEVWQSLKTSHYSVAQAKLARFLEEHRERVSNGNGEVSAKMTFGEALKIHQQNQTDDVTIKPTTRHYWNQIFVAVLKSTLHPWRLFVSRVQCSPLFELARVLVRLALLFHRHAPRNAFRRCDVRTT